MNIVKKYNQKEDVEGKKKWTAKDVED